MTPVAFRLFYLPHSFPSNNSLWVYTYDLGYFGNCHVSVNVSLALIVMHTVAAQGRETESARPPDPMAVEHGLFLSRRIGCQD